MSDPFKIEVGTDQLDALALAWSKEPQIAAEEMTRSMLEAELLLEREIKELTPAGVHGEAGGLKGSIGAQQPTVQSDYVIGVVGTALAYALPVEQGTKPHFPPIQPLADWAHYKLGVSMAEAEHVGYLIARKISISGTQGVHMFQRAFDAHHSQVETIFARGNERIAERMAAL